jgi:hypothetical protein
MCGIVGPMTRTIRTERRDSSTARVPSVAAGTALVYTRYDDEKTVVMNPEDFHRLVALDEALAEIAAGLALSPLAQKAHELEDTPGQPLEDADQVKALLGL